MLSARLAQRQSAGGNQAKDDVACALQRLCPMTAPSPIQAGKLIIVAPDKAKIYQPLAAAFADKADVAVFYDRRNGATHPSRREERRSRTTVDGEIRRYGFAVVPLPPTVERANLRKSA